MLARANKSFEAQKPVGAGAGGGVAASASAAAAAAAAAVTTKTGPSSSQALRHTLFPPSSPRETSIADCFNKPSSPLSATSSSFRQRTASNPYQFSQPLSTGVTHKPLDSRSPNVPLPSAPSGSSKAPDTGRSSHGIVTLCGQAGSFADDPPATDLLQEAQPQPQPQQQQILQYGSSSNDFAQIGFVINPDDIESDDDLLLDFEQPCALPSNRPQKAAPLPTLASAQPAQPLTDTASNTRTAAQNGQPARPFDSSFASACSWPPSSPSHFAQPPGRPSATMQRAPSAKRNDAVDADADSSVVPQPAAKKRKLPKDWKAAKEEREREQERSAEPPVTFAERISEFAATPASKPKRDGSSSAQLWDATASAVKAQKKQLKDQLKKPATSGTDSSRAGTGTSTSTSTTGAAEPAKPLKLSSEQQHVKNLVCFKNASVFFTGPAGTGKSVLMRAIIEDLRRKYHRDPEVLGVTASTGLAACNIGGMTLHSFAGIGLGKEDAQTLVRKIRRNPKAKTRWIKTKTLIIDEISMVDGDLFDKLSQVGRILRNNGRPWGGIQLVLTGDFFQLPPVPDREQRSVKFAFDATTWSASIDHTIGLTEVFRQKDPEFAQMLNEMRLGHISDSTVRTFQSLSRPLQFDDGIEVTELFPTRMEVESSNQRRLKALSGKPYQYVAADTGDPNVRDRLLQNLMAPKVLDLRVGAQVMLIKNVDESLVNGSLGTVSKFMTVSEYALAGGDDDGMPIAGLDDEGDLIRKRAKLLSVFLEGGGGAGAGAAGGGGGDSTLLPLVQFRTADGTHRFVLVRYEEWKVELPTGEVQASRHQLPLILAWALSIHKAQGQTLERVKVDLGRVFEKGQAYVALSRATSKQGLQVLRFEKHKVMAHPRVVDFYSKLYSAEQALTNKKGNASILAFTQRTELPSNDNVAAMFAGVRKKPAAKSATITAFAKPAAKPAARPVATPAARPKPAPAVTRRTSSTAAADDDEDAWEAMASYGA